MKTINSEHTIVVDVDQTLVLWGKDHKSKLKKKDNRKAFFDPYTNETVYLIPHNVHTRLLKQLKGRGYTIIVWSKAGVFWAESVVNTLGITSIVDYCMTKPDKFIDDKDDLDSIVGSRVFLKNNIE